MKPLRTSLAIAISTLALGGCMAVIAQWRAQVETRPNHFNQVLVNSSGNAVHVFTRDNQLHFSTYGEEGELLNSSTDPGNIAADSPSIDLGEGRLLVVGSSLASSRIVDTDTATVAPFDVSQLPEGAADWTLTGVTQVFSTQIAAYGSRDVEGVAQAWVMIWNRESNTFVQLDVPALETVDALFSHEVLVLQGNAAGERWMVTFDAALSELGRFIIPSLSDTLIGDSLGRPVFFNAESKNVIVRAADGSLVWEFINTEYSHIRGQSVGPEGSVLLWGDRANYSLLGFRTDNAHFLRLTPEGILAYHYLAGKNDMAKIDYRHVKQFDDGSLQLSVQGLGGELAGLLIFDGTVGVPYRTTKEILHDFVSPTGEKKRWMREPIRVEVISRTSPWLIEVVSEQGGHCNNRDVFNIGSRNLLTASELCGADTPTVVLSYY